MKFNSHLFFAFVYFFINSVALPFGLLWTSLLAPFFYGWILLRRKKDVLLPFLFFLIPFIAMQYLVIGVDSRSYILSVVNIICIYIFCQAVFTYLIYTSDPERILRQVLVINFIFCLVALASYSTPWAQLFWIEQKITDGVEGFKRLKLFTYEASYYAMLFVPLFLFFFLQWLFRQNRINGGMLLCMIMLPMILSFSIGVIAALILAMGGVFILYFNQLVYRRRIVNAIINSGFLLLVGLVVLFIFFRENAFFIRLENILTGSDTSGEGRTADAFFLAGRIISENDPYWGIGPGQLKIVNGDLIRAYYLYSPDSAVAIPNAVAETWALFGWIGLSLRFFIQLFLFFYTRAWANYFRLTLFLFMFIYQFTGSFVTNTGEYVIWILAFTNVFPQFDTRFKLAAPPLLERKIV